MSPSLHGNVLTDGQELRAVRVVVGDGRITDVEQWTSPRDGDLVVTDGWIVPGLIDLHLHGAAGVDLTSSRDPAQDIVRVSRTLVRHGVTAFCPAVASSCVDTYPSMLAAYAPRAYPDGAASLGAYLEGPFLSPAYRGVQDVRMLRDPSGDEIDRWLQADPPTVVAIAPESPGALGIVERLAEAGVVVALGHSAADVVDARAALDAGARLGTHLFNAMPPFHHRRPGLVGALLADRSVTVEVIADGSHLDPLTVDLVVRAAGPERVALVSDALAAADAPPGTYPLGDRTVFFDGESVRDADGVLAGSALLLGHCLRNVRRWLPWLSPAATVQMATQAPAAVLGGQIAARKGRVAPGYDADLAILDADFLVRATLVAGEIVWRNAGER